MKLTIGYSKKIGLADYGSFGATCGLEVELPDPDPHAAAGAFDRRARAAFAACAGAVQEELDRRREDGAVARPEARRGRRIRPATVSQLRALRAACDRRSLDLSGLVSERFGVDGPEALSVVEASRLIAELRTPSSAPPRKLQPGGDRP
ncbi:hypothetical protein [Paludisphaera mucosa]|uniref:Uncharacterized protein n=1 Tax=Paludisphaera mucosa TaxID=3030827 RepID=A0ABT6FED0_9BACT|nr:hypothetical protein [Paludisphaera mucosa]MDG3005934.1 hypothetical protein [Paludisphaera mucosa]